MRPIGTPGKGTLTRKEQNAAIMIGDHAMDDSSGTVEGPVQDYPTHLLPVLQGQFCEGLMWPNRSIVDEDVDATKFRQGPRHHTIDLLFLGHIGKERQGLAAASTDFLRDRICLSLVGAGVDDDVGSFRSQLQYRG